MESRILETIAQEYHTPAYIFDLDALTIRLQMIREQIGDVAGLCFAMKANPFLVEPMLNLVDHFEVCSPGEFAICERNQIPATRIVLSGVNKEKEEIQRVLTTYAGEVTYTIESEQQFQLLAEISSEKSEPMKVILRLSSGNQFGMDEATICRILQRIPDFPALQFLGLQYYSGTQKKKITFIERELHHLDDFCIRMQNLFGMNISVLEYGPGLYVSYFEQDEINSDAEMLTSLRKALEQMKFGGKIMLEMGRFMTADCGYYCTSVVDLKRTLDQNYCIIDGGINHINYYGQNMGMKPPPIMHFGQSKTGTIEDWHICGSLCTAGDVLAKLYPLQNVCINDLLVFKKLGAYAITEGIYLFLSRDLPKVMFYNSAKGIQLVREGLPTYPLNSSK